MKRIVLWAAVGVMLLAMGTTGLGQQSARTARQLARLENEILQLFDKKDYAGAQAKCEAYLKLAPDDSTTQYNLACALAEQGKKDEAMKALTAAVANGFPDPDLMKEDEDLEAIRGEKGFGKLIEQAAVNEKAGGEKYQPGEEIAGVKTVEDFPEDGLRYRLRMPGDADEKKPARLVVWLHPSGSSGNKTVEKLAPELAKRGFALLVFTQKQFESWEPEEADALIDKTLPSVAKVKGIDAKRPILMGYSAGGQMALELWFDKPERWGGLIVDAAYPVELRNRRMVPRALPKGKETLKGTPVLAVVGQKDSGADVWKQVADEWINKGVPLKVETVAGKGHAWLIEGDELKSVLGWLEQVGAGKLPADKANKLPGEVEL